MMRPMCCESRRPMFLHVLPPSIDLYRPSPDDTLLRALASPVPTQTMSGSEGATATSPSDTLASFSKTAVQLVPLLVVFHNPPVALATYMIEGLLSTTATPVIRPPMFAGPMGRTGNASRS